MIQPSQALSALSAGLRDPLLAEYQSIVQNYMERRWSPSELSGGKFCEIVYTILDGYAKGAYFEPLGPRPKEENAEVNGLLLCEGSTYLYLGFEAYYRSDRRQWDVYPFPSVE